MVPTMLHTGTYHRLRVRYHIRNLLLRHIIFGHGVCLLRKKETDIVAFNSRSSVVLLLSTIIGPNQPGLLSFTPQCCMQHDRMMVCVRLGNVYGVWYHTPPRYVREVLIGANSLLLRRYVLTYIMHTLNCVPYIYLNTITCNPLLVVLFTT